MAETAWLWSRNPQVMLGNLFDEHASERKLRLFAVACCRCIWSEIDDSRFKKLVDVIERAADEPMWARRLGAESVATEEALDGRHGSAAAAVAHAARPRLNVALAVEVVRHAAAASPYGLASKEGVLATYLRDIFGNPFRPVAIDPRWRNATVVDLARAIYDDRAFDRMPILADALLDAGCDDADIIQHCQGTAWHVRGCWLVDDLLGDA